MCTEPSGARGKRERERGELKFRKSVSLGRRFMGEVSRAGQLEGNAEPWRI